MDAQFSLATVFSNAVAPGRPVAFAGKLPIDRAAFAHSAAALAARLPEDGSRRWLLASEDPYAIAVGLLAVAQRGHSIVMPANLKPGHLQDLCGTGAGLLSHGLDMASVLEGMPILDGDGAQYPPILPAQTIDSAAVEIVLYTSGTTGQPVAVRKTLRSFELEVATLERTFGGGAECHILSTVPPYHMYGLLFWVLWPLLAGHPFQSEVIRFPGELAGAVRAAGAAVLVSSPAFLRRSVSALDLAAIDPHLRGVYSSGGPLDPVTAAAYNRQLTQPVVEVYGSTETGGVAYRSVYDADQPPGWTLFPGVEIEIDAAEGALSVSSALLPTAEPFKMGDRASLRADSTFDLLGRRDRVMKIEERRVSLTEVETRLAALDRVAAVRVLALEAANRRTELVAVVVPSPRGWDELRDHGKQGLITCLRAALGAHLEDVGIPRKWRFVTGLPVSGIGKTTSNDLAALFAEPDEAVLLPEVLSQSGDAVSARLTVRVPESLIYLDGHFDAHPIVPGVVQIHWAVAYARRAFAISSLFRRLEAVKFFNVLSPGDEADLAIEYDADRGRLLFGFENAHTKFSAGRVLFGDAE